MTSPEENVEQAFAAETNRLTAERFPIGGLAFVIVFAVAWVFEHERNPERDRMYALLYGLQTLSIAVAIFVTRSPQLRRYAKFTGALAAVVVIVLVGTYNVLVESQAEVLTMALLYIAIGTMVSFPWGWQGQLPVAVAAVLTLVAAVSLGTHTATSLSMHVLGLGTIGALSVSGAAYLQRQRFAVFRQAVELRTANQALAAANQALEDASRTKNEFLANVSHELRTPLNIILGYTDLLSDGEFGPLAPEAGDAVERIGKTCRTLVFLISDLLDLSRIEAGRLAIRPQVVELEGLFSEMRRFVEARLPQGVSFRTAVPNGLQVTADRDRLEQILVNLLSNATKFTRQGTIELRARHLTAEQICIEVADTGVGISAGEIGTLFEPFRQGSAGKLAGGVGIGLSLSSRLATAMGGNLHATSDVGRGATFTLVLPAAAAP